MTKKVERKKNRRISRRRLVRNPMVQYTIINLHTKYEYSSLHSFTEIFDENFIIQSMERKKIRQIQGRISRRRLICNPTYNTSLSTCIPNMNTLASTVLQKSLKKNFIIQSMERKKIGQIQERIGRRRLVRNPTIQYIIINLHTKYDYSSLHSFTEIFDEKFPHSKYGKKENQTNTQKNKQEKACSQYQI